MKTIGRVLVLLASAILFGMVQTAAAQSSSQTEVLAALTARDNAFLAGDETQVAQSMSEDYLQTDIQGKVQDKQQWLNEYYRPMAPLLKSGKTRWAIFERSDIVVRDLGGTLVLAGKLKLKLVGVRPWSPSVTLPADSPARTLRFTHVWIRRGGAWKLAVVHNAIPIEPSIK